MTNNFLIDAELGRAGLAANQRLFGSDLRSRIIFKLAPVVRSDFVESKGVREEVVPYGGDLLV